MKPPPMWSNSASNFDASSDGTPPMNKYKFNLSEANGMALFFGNAQCLSVPFIGDAGHCAGRYGGEGHLHHVLLRQHRRA